MPTFNIQNGFLNVAWAKQRFQMFTPDEYELSHIPISEAYDYMKYKKGYGPEEIIRRLIKEYIPARFVKGGHLTNRTLVSGFIGARGAGKSCIGSAVTIFDYLLRNIKVWSNMLIKVTIRYKDASVTFSTQDVDKLDIFKLDRGLQGGCLFLDEINLEFAEARRSTSNRNLKFTNMLQQLRHRDLDMVYTSQLDTFLDTRLRFQTDLYSICKDAALTPAGREFGAEIGNFSLVDTFDYSGVYTGEIYARGDFPICSRVMWIKPFWGTYDSYGLQGMDDNVPEASFSIQESIRLQELKAKQGFVDDLINYYRTNGVLRVPSSHLMGLAQAETKGAQTSLGMQLAKKGIIKEPDRNGGWEYIIPAN